MKHFATFAPSYNNIGLGVGAAVGLARGSGLIGESQEERDSTTGLGRLGKLAGYTGGGAALGAGTGMAVNAGTKYFRGRKGTIPEPRPQDRTTATEPLDDDWTKARRKPNRDEAAKNLEEKIATLDKAIRENQRPEPTETSRTGDDPTFIKNLDLLEKGISNYLNPKKASGYSGLSVQDRAAKIKQRRNLFLNNDGIPYSEGEGRTWTDEKMKMTRAIKPYKKPENTTAEDVVINNIRREAKLNKVRDINKKIGNKISYLVGNSDYIKSYTHFLNS
jgi:hypothetical protein